MGGILPLARIALVRQNRHRLIDSGVCGLSLALEKCSALVLNADFRPLGTYPLSVWHWQDAVKAVVMRSVSVVAEYDVVVRSPSCTMRAPSVIALKDYIHASKLTPAFTRRNVFLRDKFCCQYCGNKKQLHDLTFDHVIPRSKGGQTSWDNVVAACTPCNTKKANHLLADSKMVLLQKPRRPSQYELQSQGRFFLPNKQTLHATWHDYVSDLYWDAELSDSRNAQPNWNSLDEIVGHQNTEPTPVPITKSQLAIHHR